jgi:hypothetical protein
MALSLLGDREIVTCPAVMVALGGVRVDTTLTSLTRAADATAAPPG